MSINSISKHTYKSSRRDPYHHYKKDRLHGKDFSVAPVWPTGRLRNDFVVKIAITFEISMK